MGSTNLFRLFVNGTDGREIVCSRLGLLLRPRTAFLQGDLDLAELLEDYIVLESLIVILCDILSTVNRTTLRLDQAHKPSKYQLRHAQLAVLLLTDTIPFVCTCFRFLSDEKGIKRSRIQRDLRLYRFLASTSTWFPNRCGERLRCGYRQWHSRLLKEAKLSRLFGCLQVARDRRWVVVRLIIESNRILVCTTSTATRHEDGEVGGLSLLRSSSSTYTCD